MKNKKWIQFSLATAITISLGSAYVPSTYAESSVDPAPEIAAKSCKSKQWEESIIR